MALSGLKNCEHIAALACMVACMVNVQGLVDLWTFCEFGLRDVILQSMWPCKAT